MLKKFFDAGALETGANHEAQNMSVSEPLVLASETNPERKKLLDDAIQNGGLALTDQFAKSITKSVVEDIDKNNRVGGAIDLATDTLKDLEIASKVNNYSTAVLDKIVLPSISQFNKENVDNLDYSDLKFYTSLFVTENGKGPISTSIDNFIAKNFPKNPDGSYNQKQSWEKFSKGVGGAGIFQLIKQLDSKLGELSGFSNLDLQKADIENIRKVLKAYVDIANSASFDPKLIDAAVTNDSALSQNMKDFMTRNQEYGQYGENLTGVVQPLPDNIGWNPVTQQYENHGPSATPAAQTTQPTPDTTSTQNVPQPSTPQPAVEAQPQQPVQTPISQPAPDPSNDINKPVVGNSSPVQQNNIPQNNIPQSQDTSFSNIPSQPTTSSPDSQPSEVSRNETINYSDGSHTTATTTYSDKIDPKYPVVDVSDKNLQPIEENNFSSSKNGEDSTNLPTGDHQNEFKQEILKYSQKNVPSDNSDYPAGTTATRNYGENGAYNENVKLPDGQTINASVSYSDGINPNFPVVDTNPVSQPSQSDSQVSQSSQTSGIQTSQDFQGLAQDLSTQTDTVPQAPVSQPTTQPQSNQNTNSDKGDVEIDIEIDNSKSSSPVQPTQPTTQNGLDSQPVEAQPL